jgi:hypothetical protein
MKLTSFGIINSQKIKGINMTTDIYFDILNDAKTNNSAKFILEEIKKYAIKHKEKTFKRGEVTKNTLNNLFNSLQNNSKHTYICNADVVKHYLIKYLGIPHEKRDDIYELKYK